LARNDGGNMAPVVENMSIFLIFLTMFFGCVDAFALPNIGEKYNSRTGAKDFCLKVSNEAGTVVNDDCTQLKVTAGLTDDGESFTLVTGAPVGGATSMTTGQTAIPTSYAYVRKAISADPLYSLGTLADGVPGQMLTIHITEVFGNGTFRLTPSRKTGFLYLTFEAVGDRVTLLYVDDTVGWIIAHNSSVQFFPI